MLSGRKKAEGGGKSRQTKSLDRVSGTFGSLRSSIRVKTSRGVVRLEKGGRGEVV